VRERLQADLIVAIKAKQQTKVRAIRSVLAALANAEAVSPRAGARPPPGRIAGATPGLGAGDVARRQLSELDVLDILDSEIADRITTANQYDALGQTAKASDLRAEAAIVRSYLE
jgi:uncharacterized protein YqeY